MIPPASLQEWLTDTSGVLALTNGNIDEGGAISRYEIWHAGDDGMERLRVLRLEDRGEELSEIPAIFAAEVQKTCEQHAITLPSGTSLRYAIQAFRAKDDTTPESVHYIVLIGSMLAVQTGGSVSAERGQLIRHNEALHHMMMNMVQGVAGRLSRDLEEERNARQAAERRYSEVIALREEVLDRKHERQLEAAQAAHDAARQDALLQMVMTLAPAVISRLGKSSVPAAVDAPDASSAVLRDQAVSGIVNGLSVDQIQKIAMAIPPEGQIAFLELVQSYSEKQKAEQQRAAQQAAEKSKGN